MLNDLRTLTGNIPKSSSSSCTEYFYEGCQSRCSPSQCRPCCINSMINDHTYSLLKRICRKIIKDYNRQQCREKYTLFDGGNSVNVRIHRSSSSKLTEESKAKLPTSNLSVSPKYKTDYSALAVGRPEEGRDRKKPVDSSAILSNKIVPRPSTQDRGRKESDVGALKSVKEKKQKYDGGASDRLTKKSSGKSSATTKDKKKGGDDGDDDDDDEMAARKRDNSKTGRGKKMGQDKKRRGDDNDHETATRKRDISNTGKGKQMGGDEYEDDNATEKSDKRKGRKKENVADELMIKQSSQKKSSHSFEGQTKTKSKGKGKEAQSDKKEIDDLPVVSDLRSKVRKGQDVLPGRKEPKGGSAMLGTNMRHDPSGIGSITKGSGSRASVTRGIGRRGSATKGSSRASLTRGSGRRGSVTRGIGRRGSVTKGSSSRASLTRGSGRRGSVTRGIGRRGSVTKGSSSRASLTKGSGRRGSVTRGIGRRGSATKGSSRASLTRGSGRRGSVTRGIGRRGSVTKGSSSRTSLTKGSGRRGSVTRGIGRRGSVTKGSSSRASLTKGSGRRGSVTKGSGSRASLTRGSGSRDSGTRGRGRRDSVSKGRGRRDSVSRGRGRRDSVSRGSGTRVRDVSGGTGTKVYGGRGVRTGRNESSKRPVDNQRMIKHGALQKHSKDRYNDYERIGSRSLPKHKSPQRPARLKKQVSRFKKHSRRFIRPSRCDEIKPCDVLRAYMEERELCEMSRNRTTPRPFGETCYAPCNFEQSCVC